MHFQFKVNFFFLVMASRGMMAGSLRTDVVSDGI